MVEKIQDIHDKVLQFLLDYRNQNTGFTFGLRTKNNANRLKKGYWFHGNENYVAIPFWTGRDWKNKTANIFFKIEPNGKCFLEFSFLDSPNKRLLIDRIKANIPTIENSSRGYIKSYPTKNYLQEIENFIKNEKSIIDELITINSSLFDSFKQNYNKISLYSENDFLVMLERVKQYRAKLDESNLYLEESIKSIEISISNPRTKVKIEDIPSNIRWVFLTGSNGVGKSTILKAISATILGGKIKVKPEEYQYDLIPNNSNVRISIQKSNTSYDLKLKLGESTGTENGLTAFTAYGPFRNGHPDLFNLNISEEETKKRLTNCRSVFFEDAMMFNLDAELLSEKYLIKSGKSIDQIKALALEIIDLMPYLIPNLIRIEAPLEATIKDLWTETLYFLEDDDGNKFQGVNIEELSSGHKNLINFIGDMLVRLVIKQPEINELTELKGVVIIDEIDIHLHPINQKSLIEGLAETFSNIQFIVSTHSPISLLGAPKDSIFLKVERTVTDGIIVKQLEIDPRNLLPNTILNSPLFGMDDLTNPEFDEMKLLKSKDNYSETIFYSILEKMIDKTKKSFDA